MGLYQYIREQKHRNDLVGELGRWMAKNIGKRPDPHSLAFILATQEFQACHWTRHDAILHINDNIKYRRLIKIEHRISRIVSETLKIRSSNTYDRNREFVRLKGKVEKIICKNPEESLLGDAESYEVILDVIASLLPPDRWDLYPIGVPFDGVELDL